MKKYLRQKCLNIMSISLVIISKKPFSFAFSCLFSCICLECFRLCFVHSTLDDCIICSCSELNWVFWYIFCCFFLMARLLFFFFYYQLLLADRQSDRQTDRQAARQTDRQVVCKYIYIYIFSLIMSVTCIASAFYFLTFIMFIWWNKWNQSCFYVHLSLSHSVRAN